MIGSTSKAPREILLALPSTETDLYRVHQLVWKHVAQAMGGSRVRPSFVYRVDGGMVRIRSTDFPATVRRIAEFQCGRTVSVDLACIVQTPQGELPVPQEELAGWVTAKLEAAGYGVDELAVSDCRWLAGTKITPTGVQRIRIPCTRVHAAVHAVHPALCTDAWSAGIGRGKRFGLGMLAH